MGRVSRRVSRRAREPRGAVSRASGAAGSPRSRARPEIRLRLSADKAAIFLSRPAPQSSCPATGRPSWWKDYVSFDCP